MWIKDVSQNWINSDQVWGWVVLADPNDTAHYIVQGVNTAGTPITTLWTSTDMTELEAQALRLRVVRLLGAFDVTE